VVDVRCSETLAYVAQVLRLPVTFVSHFMKAEMLSAKALGLPWPRSVFCTWLAARLITAGRFHARYIDPEPVDEVAEADAEMKASRKRIQGASLLAVARRYRVRYPFLGDKRAMRGRFMQMRADEPLSCVDAEYVAADAYTAAALYQPMLLDLTLHGLHYDYHQVELPAALVLIDIELRGIRVDRTRIALAADAARAAVASYEQRLAQYGLVKALSHNERVRVFRELGIIGLFRSSKSASGYSFRKEQLKNNRGAHPVVNLLHLHAKYRTVTRDPLFAGQCISVDGCVHPWINPLGADSGRPSFKQPNLVGIGKVLRPIVVPDGPAYGLAELDFVAQEVFIAAAHFGDANLLVDCNEGDPYCAMIRRFCADELKPSDVTLTDKDLADDYPHLRYRMKILTLAITYGMSDRSVAALTKTTLDGAARLRKAFFGRYDQLAKGIEFAVQQLRDRGYAETVTGFKRYRGATGELSNWERRWAVNSVIQGGGAGVLKRMLPRIAAFLAEHGGRIILPIFDAVLVQFPLAQRDVAISGVERIMIATMRELYPPTRPRVSIEDKNITCWNKGGCSDSIERFIVNPEFKP
jgi:DNA polymerase I-like protein with 3'-5' exonuclease and polymerase domains